MKTLIGLASLTLLTLAARAGDSRWTPEQANAWYAEQPWLAGCNFMPSSAINPAPVRFRSRQRTSSSTFA